MAWITENRRTQTVDRRPEPYLTDDMKIDLANKYFPRYPNKRAVLLPALHAVQHVYGWIPTQALEEVAALGLTEAETRRVFESEFAQGRERGRATRRRT